MTEFPSSVEESSSPAEEESSSPAEEESSSLAELQELRNEIVKLRVVMEEFSRHVAASNHNHVVRMVNGLIATRYESPIEPLHHPITNSIIPNFPRIRREIYEFQNKHKMYEVLKAMNVSLEGTPDEIAYRFQVVTGMKIFD